MATDDKITNSTNLNGDIDLVSLDADQFVELVEQAQAGSDEAREEVLRSLQSYLLAIANREMYSALRPKVGASDLVQRTLHQAEQGLHNFQGATQEKLLAWVKQILRNEINQVRRTYFATDKRDIRREVPASGDSNLRRQIVDTCPTPATEAALQEEAARLRKAMAQLSADHRNVLMLRNWERLSFQDIGVRMDRSADAAKKLWARALAQLREKLGRESP